LLQDYFTIGLALLDDKLKQQIDRVLSAEEEDPMSLDFSAVLPQTNST
jgi:hypothetical protein